LSCGGPAPQPRSQPTPQASTQPSPQSVPRPTGRAEPRYTDEAYFGDLPWGKHSHWLQPWRAYLETVPASRFLDGLGVQLNLDGQNPDLVMRMLAANGIRRVRIEVGWGRLSYDETRFDIPELPAQLAAARRNGVRPLILLNANQGRPCPVEAVTRTAMSGAAAGATTLPLDASTGVVGGRGGRTKDAMAD